MNKKNTIWIIGVLLVAAIAATWFILNNQSQEQDELTAVTIIPDTGTPTDPPESEDAYNQEELMGQLIFSPDFESAISQILAENDTQFIPVFIELLRAKQIGLIPHLPAVEVIQTLEQLSGQPFGVDWAAWIEWYGGTDLTPPEGFTSWKGRLLGFIDPGFADFLQDDHASEIRVEEIVWGGVLIDGIPALDNPNMIPAGEADYLEDGDPVFGISINGDKRAYPLRILDWHEMANDVIGGEPVSLAYCTLCGAAQAYFTDDVPDGVERPILRTSGLLSRSNKVMYDLNTWSIFDTFLGHAVTGPLAGKGVKLDQATVITGRSPVIWHAASSGGTTAGIGWGVDRLGLGLGVVACSIGDRAAEIREKVDGILLDAAAPLGLDPPKPTIEYNDAHVGGGYGEVTAEELRVQHEATRLTGLIFDPTYTGKALAGLHSEIRRGRYGTDDNVIFWHTGGGFAVFAHDFTRIGAAAGPGAPPA